MERLHITIIAHGADVNQQITIKVSHISTQRREEKKKMLQALLSNSTLQQK